MTRAHQEDADFFVFVAYNTEAHGHDKGKRRKAAPRQGKEPQRTGNPLLSFTEYRREHGGCCVCYWKGRFHKHNHKTCKVYQEDKLAYFQAEPEKVPKEKRIDEWKKRQGDGGRHVGSSHGGDQQILQIDGVAESLRKASGGLENFARTNRKLRPR